MEPKWCQKCVETVTPPGLEKAAQNHQKTIQQPPKLTPDGTRIRKSGSATKYVMCVWHSKNCGQMHIPLSGLPQKP
jgi:hypothetical protein